MNVRCGWPCTAYAFKDIGGLGLVMLCKTNLCRADSNCSRKAGCIDVCQERHLKRGGARGHVARNFFKTQFL